jgi:predicted MFS family arabinose efflux permease
MAQLLPPALLFFCNAMMHIALLTRLPEIAERAGMDKATLGLCMLGGALGTFLALPIAGRVTEALGPRWTAVTVISIIAVFLPMVSLMNAAGLAACFMVYSFLRTILDVGQNMLATKVERDTGRKVMSRCHGFWSVGLLAGSLLTGAVMALGIPPMLHQAGVGVLVLVVGQCVLRMLPPDHDTLLPPATARRGIFILPDVPILLICLMIFGISLMEGAVYDWGMFFIREVVGAGPFAAGLMMACFTIGMGATRLFGDNLRERFAPSLLVRGSVLCALAGLALLLLGHGWIFACVGLTMIGCGIALNAPLAVSTATKLPGRSPANSLAALSLCMLFATLGVPPSLGFVAEHFGLTICFALLVPFLLVSFVMAPVSDGGRSWFLLRRLRKMETGATAS